MSCLFTSLFPLSLYKSSNKGLRPSFTTWEPFYPVILLPLLSRSLKGWSDIVTPNNIRVTRENPEANTKHSKETSIEWVPNFITS